MTIAIKKTKKNKRW